jgi:ABC-type dipeptide/oligopeptide/nickel transport system ATPase component
VGESGSGKTMTALSVMRLVVCRDRERPAAGDDLMRSRESAMSESAAPWA